VEDPARIEPTGAAADARLIRLVPGGEAAPHEGIVGSYRRLADVFHDVLSEQTLDALLERIADTLAELVPYEALHIYEADDASRELIPTLVRSEWAEEILRERFPYGQGITGWAVENREPVLANQAHLDPRVHFVPGTPVEPEALVAVPLISRGRMLGTLNIYRIGEDALFSQEEFELAKRFGDAAALALDNAHSRARLEHQAQTDSLTGLYNHRTFHDRLRSELMHASAQRSSVAVVMLDIDDFKKVNDIYGHGVGDHVLAALADILRGTVRSSDVVCRIGGEEFAVIVPRAETAHTLALAHRLAERLEGAELELAGTVSVSIGIAHGPEHAANPRELVACAESAMMTAKARGKNQVVLFEEGSTTERPATPAPRREEVRQVAHLKLLQSLGGKLNRLSSVSEIGLTIADELRGLIDYHNCRVFLRHGDDLRPIAFRGELTATPKTAMEVFACKVGEGITGRVAATGEPLLVPDAAQCEYAIVVPGTNDIEESLLAVPLDYGARTIGVIVVSKLGTNQFDEDDLRLLEVLAGHAAVALENARLYEAQRREAEGATALLEFSRELAGAEGIEAVLEQIVESSARLLGSPQTSFWLQDALDGDLRARAAWGYDGEERARLFGRSIPAALLESFRERTEPYLVEPEDYAEITGPPRPGSSGRYAVAPLHVEGHWGVIAAAAPRGDGFGERELHLLGGLAHQAKLAVANAWSFAGLERTFIATVEALANALEANDEYTSTHARWITDTSILVGVELGLDARSLRRLQLGALLHDIGKIGISSTILSKPGPLTSGEREIIETHPALGERILAPIEQLQEVRPIVRACHERWDGSGYPDGRAGAEIPLESRIIFACDAYHAMTTDRPYRLRLPVDEALRRLAEGAGTQFDPGVVEICLRVLAP
jgi:diguanylate cyclase (GGDEF)-like protein